MSLAPHAPSFVREYSQTLLVGAPKRVKIPWHAAGTVWLWSSQPGFVDLGLKRLDVAAAAGGVAAGSIPVVFPPQALPGFRTVDVHVSAAPPEFSNARRFLLRFHLTYVAVQSGAAEDPGAAAAAQAAAESRAEAQQIRRLEQVMNAERLMQLEAQCAKLHSVRCKGGLLEPAGIGPPGGARPPHPDARHAFGVPRPTQGFSPMYAHGVQQSQDYPPQQRPHPHPHSQPQQRSQPQPRRPPQDHHAQGQPTADIFAGLQDQRPPAPSPPPAPRGCFADAPTTARVEAGSTARSESPRARARAEPRSAAGGAPPRGQEHPTVRMENGWFASYDSHHGCPYYFQPEHGIVQWDTPPGQGPASVSRSARPRAVSQTATSFGGAGPALEEND